MVEIGTHKFERVYVSPVSDEVFVEGQYEDWLWEVASHVFDRLPKREQKLTSIQDLVSVFKNANYRWNRTRRCIDCGEIVKDNEMGTHYCAFGDLGKVAKGTYMRRRSD